MKFLVVISFVLAAVAFPIDPERIPRQTKRDCPIELWAASMGIVSRHILLETEVNSAVTSPEVESVLKDLFTVFRFRGLPILSTLSEQKPSVLYPGQLATSTKSSAAAIEVTMVGGPFPDAVVIQLEQLIKTTPIPSSVTVHFPCFALFEKTSKRPKLLSEKFQRGTGSESDLVFKVKRQLLGFRSALGIFAMGQLSTHFRFYVDGVWIRERGLRYSPVRNIDLVIWTEPEAYYRHLRSNPG